MICNDLFPILFADDTAHSDFKALIQHAKNGMSSIYKWFQMNKHALNVQKFSFMIFCNKNKKHSKDDAKMFINNMFLIKSTIKQG